MDDNQTQLQYLHEILMSDFGVLEGLLRWFKIIFSLLAANTVVPFSDNISEFENLDNSDMDSSDSSIFNNPLLVPIEHCHLPTALIS